MHTWRKVGCCLFAAVAAGVSFTAAADLSKGTDPIRLVGDFGRRVLVAGASAKVTDLSVVNAYGVPLSPEDYSTVYENNSASGTATVRVTVNSGALSGAEASQNFEIVVLPAGLAPVEWIGSTGAQWIDTGVAPTKTGTGIDMRFGQVATSKGAAIFAQQNATWNYYFLQIASVLKFEYNKDIPGFAEGRDYHLVIEPYDADLGGGRVTMDYGDGPITYTGYQNSANTGSGNKLGLFGSNDGDGRSTYRLYGFKMTEDGDVVRDLVPVRRLSDGKPGLFDCAHPDAGEGALFFNKGSGADFRYGADLADFRPASPVPAQVFNGVDSCNPVVGLVDRRTGRPLASADFTFVYAGGDAVGTGSVTITGKANTDYAGQVVVVTYPVLQPYRVTSDAEGGSSGLAWTSPMTLDEALAAVAANGGAIWMKSDVYPIAAVKTLTTSKPVVICGGFAGDETKAEDRPADGESVLDANYAAGCLKVTNDESADVVIERVAFARGLNGMLVKTGAGGISLSGCAFRNGRGTSFFSGTAASLTGVAGVSSTVVSNCVFEGNVCTAGKWASTGLYLSKFTCAEVTDCLFLTNGVPWDVTRDPGQGSGGAALHIADTRAEVRGCSFRGNRSPARLQITDSTTYVTGKSGGTVFENCLWSGNCTAAVNKENNANPGGVILIAAASSGERVTFERCTIAYNYADNYNCPGGVRVTTGTVDIRDSILYGNTRKSSASGCGQDLAVLADGYATAVNTRFTSGPEVTGANASITSKDASHLSLHPANVDFGDPYFVDSLESAVAAINNLEVMIALDCHVRPMGEDVPFTRALGMGYTVGTDEATVLPLGQPAVTGVAVSFPQAGSTRPQVDVTLGSEPSGTQYLARVTVTLKVDGVALASETVDGVVNGQTVAFSPECAPEGGSRLQAEVCVEAAGAETIADDSTVVDVPDAQPVIEDITLSFPDGYSRASVDVTMGGRTAGSIYSATVTVLLYTNGYMYGEASLASVTNGQTVTLSPGVYVDAGDEVSVVVRVTADGAADVTDDSVHAPATGVKPPWYAAKGGPNVIHVRQGADSGRTGESWLDAFDNLADAVAALSSEKNEIWIAGEFALASELQIGSPSASFVVRGGFDSSECSAAARKPETPNALIDCAYACRALSVANGAGVSATFERITFAHGLNGMFVKTGAGDVKIAGCVFQCAEDRNSGTAYNGLGANLTGTAAAHAVVSNCVFRENNAICGNMGGTGLGLYLSTFASADVVGCSFIRNGERIGGSYNDYLNGFGAAALYVNAAPTLVKGCRFTGNLAVTRTNNQTLGSTLTVEGASGGTVLENCLFYGNSTYSAENGGGNTSGNIRLSLAAETDTVEIRNCTIAYNYNDCKVCASGISLTKGDLKIVNSIIYDNVRNTSAGASTGADLWVRATGRCDVSYSIITADTNANGSATSIVTADPSRLTIDRDTTKFVDPLFVTDRETAEKYIHKGSSKKTKAFLPEEIETVMAFALHLRGGFGYYDETTGEIVKDYARRRFASPAIDTGDPTVKCVEPHPNMNRVNMGAYGNTPWATLSKGGTMIFVR